MHIFAHLYTLGPNVLKHRLLTARSIFSPYRRGTEALNVSEPSSALPAQWLCLASLRKRALVSSSFDAAGTVGGVGCQKGSSAMAVVGVVSVLVGENAPSPPISGSRSPAANDTANGGTTGNRGTGVGIPI